MEEHYLHMSFTGLPLASTWVEFLEWNFVWHMSTSKWLFFLTSGKAFGHFEPVQREWSRQQGRKEDQMRSWWWWERKPGDRRRHWGTVRTPGVVSNEAGLMWGALAERGTGQARIKELGTEKGVNSNWRANIYVENVSLSADTQR